MSVRSAITLSCCLFRQSPAVVTMVNHLPGHATVDADILACDESCLVGAEEHRLSRMLPYFYIPLTFSLPIVLVILSMQSSVFTFDFTDLLVIP